MSPSLEPTPEQFAALAARPADEPVVMINLLQFRAEGGRQSYLRYTREVTPTCSGSAGRSATRALPPTSSSATARHLGGTPFSSSNTLLPQRFSTW